MAINLHCEKLGVHMAVSEEASNLAVSNAQPPVESGRGKPKRTKIWYTVKSFICHNDNDDWRVDI